jgi:selenocysteine lyase/cysteine desulfurase
MPRDAGRAGDPATAFDEEPPMPGIDPALIREEFPLTREWTYLATAANGILPERSRRYLEGYFREQHHLELAQDYHMFDDLEALRAKAAALFGGRAGNYALMPNTCTGLNTVAAGLPWREGDSVVLADCEFPANVYPWKNLARRGVSIRWVAASERKAPAEDFIETCDASTRAVSLSGVQFLNGYAPDLARLAAFCRERGIWLCVDGIQGLGNRHWNLPALGVDFLSAGGQKWLCSPRGTGLLYFGDRALAALNDGTLAPAHQGWLNWAEWKFSELLDYERPLSRDTRQLEVGSYAFHDLICLSHALDLLGELGLAAVAEHCDGLREELLDELAGRRLLAPEGPYRPSTAADPPARRSQILALGCPDAIALYKALAARKIAVNPREGGIRVSFHYYNSSEDVARLVEALDETARASRG